MSRRLAGAAALLALGACGCREEPPASAAGASRAVATAGPARATAAHATRTVPPGAAGPSPRAAASPPHPAGSRAVLRIVGFRTPRSVLHDPVADVYLVSNVNGDPAAADDDDNGFISRISPDGQVLDLKWIDGDDDEELQLSAPMGLALHQGRLWVADRNQIHAFDARTGRHRASYRISRATALADLTILDGAIIASDNGSELAGGLFRLGSSRTPRRYLGPGQSGVGHPQGVFAPDDRSIWVTAGRELYLVVKGARTAGAELPRGSLEGIVGLPGGDLLVASLDGVIFRGAPRPTPGGSLEVTWTELFTELQTPSDIGLDARRNRLLIPLVLANAVEIRDLPPP